MVKKDIEKELEYKNEYISILESTIAHDTNTIQQLRKTINSLMAYKIKANIKINNLKKEIKELKDGKDK